MIGILSPSLLDKIMLSLFTRVEQVSDDNGNSCLFLRVGCKSEGESIFSVISVDGSIEPLNTLPGCDGMEASVFFKESASELLRI